MIHPVAYALAVLVALAAIAVVDHRPVLALILALIALSLSLASLGA